MVKTKDYAYISATSPNGDPQNLTSFLEITPTEFYKKNEISRPNGRPHKFSRWSYNPKSFQSESIEESIKKVTDFVLSKNLDLTNLPDGFTAYISCVSYRNTYNGGVHFNSDTTKALGKIGLAVDCDIYCLTEEEAQENPTKSSRPPLPYSTQNILTPLGSSMIGDVLTLSNNQFGSIDDYFYKRLKSNPGALLTVASLDERVVGYKLGYKESSDIFYSWLGVVHPDFRRQGVASTLMESQHSWCRKNGYKAIRTKTKNSWRSMLLLNIKHGFDVIETYLDSENEPKILLEKKL